MSSQTATPITTPNKPKAPTDKRPGFHRYFTRNGVTYDAHKYGHKAWPIGFRQGKKK